MASEAPGDDDSPLARHQRTERRTRLPVRVTRVASEDVMRGTDTATLLSGCGRRLRRTAGGRGSVVTEEADNDFARSFQVLELDIFLSHSWHADWRQKYVALLFYFNNVAASVLGACAGIACFLVQYLRRSELHDDTTCNAEAPPQDCNKIQLWCFLVGGSTYLAVLFSWHYAVALVPERRRAPVLFLDKICIHQTDPVLKAQGIASLGGILARSSTFLVAWDATYFSRLWCLYEMSAFKTLPGGAVAFVPLSSGGLTVALLCGEALADGLACFMDRWLALLSIQEATDVYTACWFLTALVWSSMLRRHAEDLAALDGQLANFSVEEAECFCCKVGHVHPETGAPLTCDRQHVYAAIARRRAEGDLRKALQDFNREIRTSFKDDIRAAGWGSKVPYTLVLSLGAWSGLASLDFSFAFRKTPWVTAANAVFWSVLVFPLVVGATMELLILLPCRPRSVVGRRSLELCAASFFTALLTALIQAHRCMSDRGPRSQCLSLSLQAAGVWFLYFRQGCQTRILRRRGTLHGLPSAVPPDVVPDKDEDEELSPGSSASSRSGSPSRSSSAGSLRSRQSCSSTGSCAARC